MMETPQIDKQIKGAISKGVCVCVNPLSNSEPIGAAYTQRGLIIEC